MLPNKSVIAVAEGAWWKSGLTVHKFPVRQKMLAKANYLNPKMEDSQTCKQPFSVTKAILGKSLFLPAFQLLGFHSLSVTFSTQNIKQDKNLHNTSFGKQG